MKTKNAPAIVIIVVSLSALLSVALAEQDRFTLKAPNGVALSEFITIRHMAGCGSESDGKWNQGYSGKSRDDQRV